MLAGGFTYDEYIESSYVIALDLLNCEMDSFLAIDELTGGIYAVHIDRNVSKRFLIAGYSFGKADEIIVVF